ncbi:MAG: hypothetical protein QNJ63_29195, partial [Calothrix sp. MO_192.B10]|nr:hypothetical protein [Calothrix sp. MO_192.B10]
ATCFMPGNPFGLRHLLYAGEPLRVAPLALCRGTRPPQWLTVHRSGLPSTAVAYRPPQWLTVHRSGSFIRRKMVQSM